MAREILSGRRRQAWGERMSVEAYSCGEPNCVGHYPANRNGWERFVDVVKCKLYFKLMREAEQERESKT